VFRRGVSKLAPECGTGRVIFGAYEMNTSKECAQSTQTPQPLTREQWLLSLPQAQASLGGIGPTLLYKLIDTGSIQRVKIGRRAFVTQASVDAFVESLTAA
jgi:hypothetical protein